MMRTIKAKFIDYIEKLLQDYGLEAVATIGDSSIIYLYIQRPNSILNLLTIEASFSKDEVELKITPNVNSDIAWGEDVLINNVFKGKVSENIAIENFFGKLLDILKTIKNYYKIMSSGGSISISLEK